MLCRLLGDVSPFLAEPNVVIVTRKQVTVIPCVDFDVYFILFWNEFLARSLNFLSSSPGTAPFMMP
ncbi:MAG: hypothetical protein QW566_09340, partial [Candidatus Jordarchaeales archaeon]